MTEEEHTVLVVDDDPDIRALVVTVLGKAGYRVVEAESGAEALDAARAEQPQLITLDLGLPDMDGTEVCRRLREFTDAYLIMLTGRTEESARLTGLDLGADDYMDKPFSPRELRARVAAFLRRSRPGVPAPAPQAPPAAGAGTPRQDPAPRLAAPHAVEAGRGLVVVPDRDVALLDGEPLPLTAAEVAVLAVLAAEPGRVWQRRELARAVWAEELGESHLLLDIHVGNLRRKLRKASPGGEWIRSVGGTAYALRDDLAPARPGEGLVPPPTSPPTTT